MTKSFEVPQYVRDIIKKLDDQGYRVWIVGGAIRDFLAGNQIADYDVCTNARPRNVQKLFSNSAGYNAIPTGIKYGTVTILHPDGGQVEVTTLRKDISTDGRKARVRYTDDLVEDLSRRDFTINAIAYDPKRKEFIDPFSGIEDINARTVRCVGKADKRFKEDYLRMLRACRLAGYGTGFVIEPETFAGVKKNASKITKISRERVRDELVKMMKLPKPSKCINAMRNSGLLRYVLPELIPGIKCMQNVHHVDDVYTHTLMVVDASSPRHPRVRFGCLFHDIAKPQTREVKENGAVTFYNHEIVGADICYKALKRLRFSKHECEEISLLVRHHMFRFDINSKRKTIKRWMNKTTRNGVTLYRDLLRLRVADRKGNRAKWGKPLITRHFKNLVKAVREIEKFQEPMTLNDLAIDGDDLRRLGFKPGPVFKEILDYLLDKVQEDPKANNKVSLITFVHDKYIGKKPNIT